MATAGNVVVHPSSLDRQGEQATLDATIYRRQLGECARDVGMSRAEAADAEWFEKVLVFIDDLDPGDVIAADDVRSRFGSSQAMGSAFRTARRRGLITSIGHRTSCAPSRHRGEQRLWLRLPDA